MIGFLSAYSERAKHADKKKILFLHIISSIDEDVKIEVAPLALNFARAFKLKKVYLFYGKDKRIVYDYSL